MAMDAGELQSLIKTALPDAHVEIRDLAGDGDHYAAVVISESFRGNPACSSTRWCIRLSKGKWAAICMHSHCKPLSRNNKIQRCDPCLALEMQFPI